MDLPHEVYRFIHFYGGVMDKELRQMLLTLRKERDDFCQLRRALREQGNDWLPYPEHLRAVPCGATTRAGTPCKMTTIYHNGRCC